MSLQTTMTTTINTEVLKNIATTLAELSTQLSTLCAPKRVVTVTFKWGISQNYDNAFALKLFKTDVPKLDIDHKDMHEFLLGTSYITHEFVRFVLYEIDQSQFTEDGYKELYNMAKKCVHKCIPVTCAFINGSSAIPNKTCLIDLEKFTGMITTAQERIVLENLLNIDIKSQEIANIVRPLLVKCLGTVFVEFVKNM